MKALSLLPLLALGAAQPPIATFSDATPPESMRGGGTMTITFVADVTAPDACGEAGHGYRFLACTRDGATFMPNPCDYDREFYAHFLCHEKAHRIYGWSAAHEDGVEWKQ